MKSIKVPHLTPNEDFVSVTKIFKNNGSKVKKGELIFEIETTKTSVEIESEHSGYIFINLNQIIKLNVEKNFILYQRKYYQKIIMLRLIMIKF